jgi:hypothetical protein
MALECQHGIVAHHAATVVGDLDQLLPARFDADLDARCPGVQRVLEHFLNDGRRTLHHFAGGDLVGYGLGEYVDSAHGSGVRDRGSVVSVADEVEKTKDRAHSLDLAR